MIMLWGWVGWVADLGVGGRADRPAWCPVLLVSSGLWMVSGCCRSDEKGLADLGEPSERGGELGGPGPAGVDSDSDFALAVDDPGGGVEQPVAQLLRFGLSQVVVEEGGLGPGDQVGGGQRQLQPHLVDGEVPGREAAHAGVFDRFDPVLDMGVGAVSGFEEGQLAGGGVGGYALVAPAVVGLHEADLGAGMGA